MGRLTVSYSTLWRFNEFRIFVIAVGKWKYEDNKNKREVHNEMCRGGG